MNPLSPTVSAIALTCKDDAAVNMIEINEKKETDLRVFQNINDARSVSDAAVSPEQRQETKSHVSPRRLMAGRRAASSTTLGTQSKRRHAFPRHSSLRGWRKNDGTLGEIPEERNDEKEEIDFVQIIIDARSVSDANVSPQERQVTTCIVSEGKHESSNSQVSPRSSLACIASAGKHAAPNSHVSRISSPIISPRRSPRRSMTGRRATSSMNLGAGSKGTQSAFRRQSSLRGWRESDSGHDGTLVEISEAKCTRLHDYTERPIGDCKLPFHQYD
jgi:hypothetical protein